MNNKRKKKKKKKRNPSYEFTNEKVPFMYMYSFDSLNLYNAVLGSTRPPSDSSLSRKCHINKHEI
jgi:hypothetical protein